MVARGRQLWLPEVSERVELAVETWMPDGLEDVKDWVRNVHSLIADS